MKDKNASGSITKAQVMLEIRDVASNAQQQLKTPLMRFIRCPQLQRASALLGHALRAERCRDNDHSRLAAPPSFVPPLQ
jgi:hypothetical protein